MLSYQKYLLPIIIVVASALGGALSNFWLSFNASAAYSSQDISANSIRLVDHSGRTMAGLIIENGAPVLFINDKGQNTRIALGVGNKGPLLAFKDANGSMNLFIQSGNDGSPSIGLMKTNKQPRIMISYFPGQGPTIGLFDENNIGKAIISVTDGNPSVTLLDQDKKPAIAMISKRGKGSLLGVWNSRNEPRISLGLLKDKPTFFMYEQYQTGLLFNMQSGGRPALALMDSGSPIWSATGAVPSAPELPPMDDMLREITR